MVKDKIDYYIGILAYVKYKFKSFIKKGSEISKLKLTIRKDLEDIKTSIIKSKGNLEKIDNIYKSVSKEYSFEYIQILRIDLLFSSIKKIKKSALYRKNIERVFNSYYSKLDIFMEKFIHKKEVEKKIRDIEGRESYGIDIDLYRKEKIDLQVELVKLQEWVKRNKKKVVIVFEGRDAAGKGSSIKRFVEYLNPKHYRVVAKGIPSKKESENWFERYYKEMPKRGEIVFFDRSWYNRAVIEPTMGYCTKKQYKDFMNNVNAWEKDLNNEGIVIIKFWFSVRKDKQVERFESRKKSPLKYWKYSENDKKSISKWDVITKYKKQMFEKTSTEENPWVVINSNDKRVSRLNSIRYVLSKFNYSGKDTDKNITPNTKVLNKI